MKRIQRFVGLLVGSVLARAQNTWVFPRTESDRAPRPQRACEHAAYVVEGRGVSLDRHRRMRRLAFSAMVALSAFLVGAEWIVQRAAAGRIFEVTDGVPPADVALVLGTARSLGHGVANRYYAPRLDAAAELFRCGKVRGIIVSGDNSRADYSEPDDMKSDLVARGVPAQFVTCDYAGFSTRDSMQRVSRVFGQSRVIVVSQRFHLERALYLAREDGLAATGCVAAEAPLRWRIRVRLREVFARAKAVLEVALGRGPKFLGPREPVLLAGAD